MVGEAVFAASVGRINASQLVELFMRQLRRSVGFGAFYWHPDEPHGRPFLDQLRDPGLPDFGITVGQAVVADVVLAARTIWRNGATPISPTLAAPCRGDLSRI